MDHNNCFKVESGLVSGFLDSVKEDFNQRSHLRDYDVWICT